MSIYTDTLADLVEQVCKLVHDWTEGTATGGDATKLLDATNRVEVDDYWNDKGAYIYIQDGLAAGDYRKVSDFKNTGGEIDPVANFSGVIAATDAYSLHTEFKRDEVVEMINLAIEMVAEEAMVWAIDETTIDPLVAGTYEYDLPTSFMYLFRVTMADSDGDFDGQDPVPSSHYRILHAATPALHFTRLPEEAQYYGHYYGELWADSNMTAGRALRLEGLASPDVLADDTSTCPISPAFVVFQAAALLHASRIRSPENEPDAHRVQSKIWQDKANLERARIVPVQLPAGSKRLRE